MRQKIIILGIIIGLSSVSDAATLSQVWDLKRSVSALESKHPEKAERLAESALKKGPDSAALEYDIGNTKLELKKWDEAIMRYEKALKLATKLERVPIHYNLGTAHLRAKNYEKAIDHFKRVLIETPTHKTAKIKLEVALKQMQEDQKNKKRGSKNQDPSGAQNKSEGDKKETKRQKEGESQKQSEIKKQNANAILKQFESKEEEAKKKNTQRLKAVNQNPEKDW